MECVSFKKGITMIRTGDVGVAIPHYGDDSLLDKCIKSFEDSIGKVEVWNNNDNNMGFTAAVNLLIGKIIRAHDPAYIAVVNNDTAFVGESMNAFSAIVDFMENHPEVGIASPKIVSESNPDMIVHGGGLQCFPNGIHKTGSVGLGHLSKWSYEKWLQFAVVVIRTAVIEEIGLLDKNMFLICSDSDYCYRARYAGWKCAYCPDETWTHKMGESSKPSSPEVEKIMRKDSFVFFKKWIEPSGVFLELDKEIL